MKSDTTTRVFQQVYRPTVGFNITPHLNEGELAPKRSLSVISSHDKAKVLVDPMRREIIRLLSGQSMTQNELALALGLSNTSVAHHIKLLSDNGLVKVEREEKELHGILQKFYTTTSLAYFVDTRKLPLDIQRYFMPTNLERVRGVLAAINVTRRQVNFVPTKDLEEFAEVVASAIAEVGPKFETIRASDREEVIARLHHEALRYLLDKPDLIPDSVRKLLLNETKKK